MASTHPDQTLTEAGRWPIRGLFIAIITLGSFLLFLIQPLFARLVLPVLGGAPAVWNTAMLFYQAALLVGYAYAHAISRLSFRRQLLVHAVLFAGAVLTLPIGLRPLSGADTGDGAAFWLLQLLAVSIGPVFVAVAAQAPLMQAWFARSDDPRAGNPYFLYAASNVGSLGGLLCYPFLIEPFTALPSQQWLWSGGFVLLFALMMLGGMAILRAGPRVPATSREGDTSARAARPITTGRRIRWVLLAAVPSGLMLSTTTHITTDIMTMPLLWVIPLAVYLISFILVFSSHGAFITRGVLLATAPALLLFGGAGFMATAGLSTLYGFASILLLLLVAISLHGVLAMDRPPAARLTEFYFWMSLGGVVGGLFPALIAPRVFDWTYEHPILLLLAALLLPARPLTTAIGRLWQGNGLLSRGLRILAPPLTLALGWWLGASFMMIDPPPAQLIALCVIGGLAILAIGRPIQFTWHLAMLMLALGGWQQIDISTIDGARQRSFFGIYTIENSRSENSRRLLHGTTLHGTQSMDPARSRLPLTYYAPESGVGLAMRHSSELFGDKARIGVVGLGTGSLLCYAQPAQDWTVFEIDPMMVRIATDPEIFSYVSQCRPDVRIVVGDARLKLAEESVGRFDILAVDAFSSDAIPLHLLTREAVQSYVERVSEHGLVLLHISNRFLDLEPVIAAIATDLGISARILYYSPDPVRDTGMAYNASMWVALTRNEDDMTRFTETAGNSADWLPLRRNDKVRGWTDGFASVLHVFKGL